MGLVFRNMGDTDLKIESIADQVVAFQIEQGISLGAFHTAAWLTSLWIDLDWFRGFKALEDPWIWEN